MPDPLTVVTATPALPADPTAGPTAQPPANSTASLSPSPAPSTDTRGVDAERSDVYLRWAPERTPLDEIYATKTGILNPPSSNLTLDRIVGFVGEINHWPRAGLGNSQTSGGGVSPTPKTSASLSTINHADTHTNAESPPAANAFSQTLDDLAQLNSENIQRTQVLSQQAAEVSIWAAKLELVTTALSKASQSLNHILRIQ